MLEEMASSVIRYLYQPRSLNVDRQEKLVAMYDFLIIGEKCILLVD
jgi:hypothetical protein